MKSLLSSVTLLAALLASPISAGKSFSDRVYERYARPEKFSQPIQERRPLQERQAGFKFLTNTTQREYPINNTSNEPHTLTIWK